MSTDAKKEAPRTSRFVTSALVVTGFIIFAAALYSSPRTAPAAAAATTAVDFTNDGAAPESIQAAEYAKTKRTKNKRVTAPPAPAEPVIGAPPAPAPPPPPAEPEHGVVHPAPTVPPQPASPAAPSTPAAPVAPPAEKRKSTKQKGASKGQLIEAPPPVYPEDAKKQKIEGLVTVAIVIGEEGNVISARAKSGPDALRPAAEDAARKARFKPTTVDDKPAKVSGVISYNFVSKN